MLGEKEVRKIVTAVRRHEARTALFRPKCPSARRPKTAEPVRIHGNSLRIYEAFSLDSRFITFSISSVKF